MELPRASRVSPPPTGDVAVEAPPDVPKAEPVNLLARLLPVAMLVAMAGMTVLYFTSGAATSRSPMFLLFPVMMMVSVLGSVAYGARGSRRGGELDEDRRAYLRYLDAVDHELARTAVAQHASLHWDRPDPAALWTLVGESRMWDRRRSDPDFCHVRIGTGTLGLSTTLVAPEPKRSESSDPVTTAALARLVDQRSSVPDLPVTLDLIAHPRLVVHGQAGRALVRAMLCQLAVSHGPDVVEISAVGRVAENWDWLKWLPHHEHSRAKASAHRVVVVDGADDSDLPADGVSAIAIDQTLDGQCLHLDVETSAMIERPDALSQNQAVVCARRLARYLPRAGASEGAEDWSQLVGVGDPARIEGATAWRPRTARRRLCVPIGTSDDGSPVELDIKEAARGGMGPHGLCIGATGSGKSEFLRTLALGLVATHAPDDVNLVLVDFKGGATFLGFERLRHVAAVVTNLADEAHLVERMRDALAGEMTRRQTVLRAAGNFANTHDYAAARASGADLPPLPALVVVVDEFSELLSQHPEFAELFVAMGRVGRSLGIHLLLASQRLDEGRLRGLETHLSYRICLKTFSAGESRAVLGTTDAYDLPGTPGAAFLKSASGDLVRFQTAFVSGPVSTSVAPATPVPTVFRVGPAEAPRAGSVRAPGCAALLDTVVNGLAGHGEPAHQVWLPPLDAAPPLAVLLSASSKDRMVVPIGLVDNPFAQRREALLIDLRGSGGNVAVVGGPRSGKTTALHTLLLALAVTSDPDRVQMYGLDFGGGSLSALRLLPHLGAVAGRSERDLARRIVAHVRGLVQHRQMTCRDHGTPSAGSQADVFLVIDGWAVVRQEFEGMEETISAIGAQGLSVGVHVVVAASRWADIRPALKDQLSTRIELRLGDPAESEMDRKRARLLGDRPAGHGITSDGLEFAIARPLIDGVEESLSTDDALRAGVRAMTIRYPAQSVPPVRLLPGQVIHAAVAARSPNQLVLGLGEDELRPVALDFRAHPHLLILGESECGKTSTLRTVCREIVRIHDGRAARILVVDPRRTLLGVVESDHLAGYAMSPSTTEAQVVTAAELLTTRLPTEQVTQTQLRDRSWWSGPDVYVVVDDYDLVAGAAGNPLTALLDLLPHARDVGLHVVICRRSGGAARAMFDPMLARLKDLGCMGLMMSASPEEGPLLGSSRPSPLPAGRGTLIRRGQPDLLVQVSWTEPP